MLMASKLLKGRVTVRHHAYKLLGVMKAVHMQ